MRLSPGGNSLQGSLSLRGSMYEWRVHKKQQEDARNARLFADAQRSRWLQHVSKVCKRSEQLAEAAGVRHRAKELRKTYVNALSQRRAALKELFDAEEEQYQKELRTLEVQPEQRREQLMERARQLRQKRVEEKKQIAQELRYKSWMQYRDELKTADSKLHALETLTLRDEQLYQKALQKLEDASREKLFDALWLEGYLKKAEKERTEQQRHAAEKLLTKSALLEQLAMRQEQRKKEKENLHAEHIEQRQLEAQRSQQARKEREAEQQRSLQKRQELNEAISEQRKKKENLRKHMQEQDRIYLKKEQEKMHLQDQEESHRRDAARRCAAGYKEELRCEMLRKAQDRKETDQIYLHEQEKEWEKREAQWKYEEECRRRLMQEVEQSRTAFRRRKSQEREAEKKQKEELLRLAKQEALAFQEEILAQKREKVVARGIYRKQLHDQLEQLRLQRTEHINQDKTDYLDRLHMEKQMEDVCKSELDRRRQLLELMAERRRISLGTLNRSIAAESATGIRAADFENDSEKPRIPLQPQ